MKEMDYRINKTWRCNNCGWGFNEPDIKRTLQGEEEVCPKCGNDDICLNDFFRKEKESRRLGVRGRFQEEASSLHTYRFLINTGEGAANRSSAYDEYIEKKVGAKDLRSAAIKVFKYLNFERESFKAYMEDYFGDDPDKPTFKTGEDILDWLDENNDISGGDPWVEGLAIDGKIIKDPDYLRDYVQEGDFYADDFEGIDLNFWGIELDEDEDEDFEESRIIRRKRF